MSFQWSTAEIEAIARLGQYNGNPYNPTTNPRGLANGGHRVNFAPANNDTSTTAVAIRKAADYAGGQAEAAGQSASDAAAYAAKMSGTSATSVAIGAGERTFTTQTGKFFAPGTTLRIASAANPLTAYMVARSKGYAGATLTVDVLIFVGTGTAADWLIYTAGELGPAGTLAIASVTALAPDKAPTIENTGTASAASLKIGIPRGFDAGLYYKWSSDTTAAAANGVVKASSLTLTNAERLYISEQDANGIAWSAVIASWDDSTNSVRGTIRVRDIGDPNNWVTFSVTGAISDNGPFDTIPVAYVDKGSPIPNGASVVVEFVRAGDRGLPGLNGQDGAPATIAVESTETLAPGAPATVENIGSAAAARLKVGIPRGAKGDVGPVVAVRYNFDTATIDGDPAPGNLRFNSANQAGATQIFVDDVEATGGTPVSVWLDTFDDSTNPSIKGTLTLKDTNDQSKFVIYDVTGAVVNGGGYRKLQVQFRAGSGGFAAGAQLGMSFDRSGDKGADGGGAGNVVGPATATQGNFALFGDATGKLLLNGGKPGALATKDSINGNDWSGAVLTIGNGGTGGNTITTAQQGLNLVPGTHVQQQSAKLQALADLAWTAGLGFYITGASSVGTYATGAFGRSLAGAADVGAAQQQLQLRPGVDVLPIGGGSLTGALILAADPTAPLGAASKQYVDQLIQGIDPKQSAKAASVGNLTLSGEQTVDGVALISGDRVLVKNQSTASQNGLYVVAAGAWARALDADVWIELVDAYLFVEQGSQADTAWVCTADQGGSLGTTAVTFVQFGNTAIADDSISNSKLANMPAGTLKGNAGGTTADPVDLTVSQVKGLLAYALSELSGVLQAAQFPALTGAITTAAGSLATSLSDGAVTFAKLAAAAIASAASDVWTNAASKVATIAGLWASLAPVDWGTISGTYAPSLSAFLNAKASLSASLTLANPANVKGGEAGEILFTMGAANLTISYGSAWKSLGATPTAPTTTGAQCVLSYRVFDASNIVFTLTKVGA